jgi:hypothetical protein
MWARPLVALIRRRVGLGAVASVELHEYAGALSTAASRQFLAALGIAPAGRPCGASHAPSEAAVESAAS